MTYEEALKEFEEVLMPEVAVKFSNPKCGLFAKIRKALEKQIPKKPYWEYGVYHCKTCGLDISEDDAYCPLCGQAIDWRDYE